MSDHWWSLQVLFESAVPTEPIIRGIYDWMVSNDITIDGISLNPLDPEITDNGYEPLLVPVDNIEGVVASLLQHPGLGSIEGSLTVPGKSFCANLTAMVRDAIGTPEVLDYIVFSMAMTEFEEISPAFASQMEDYVLWLASNLRPIWITKGYERDYFPGLLGSKSDVEMWRHGQGLIPLDVTWLRGDFYDLARSFLPSSLSTRVVHIGEVEYVHMVRT